MNNKSARSENIGSFLFLIVYIPCLFVSSLSTTLYNQKIPVMYFTGAVFITLAVITLKVIIFDRHSLFEYILYTCTAIVAVLSYYYSDNRSLLVMIIFMLASVNLNNNQIIRWYIFISISILIFSFISTKMGWILDLEYTRNMVLRHSFGIVYPTDFAAHVFYICCGYVYLRFEKYSFIDAIGLMILAMVLYHFTDARLNTGMIIFLAVATLLIKIDVLAIIAKKVMWCVPILGMLFTYIATKNYSPISSVSIIVNKWFSGRLGIVQDILNKNGFKLFGQKIAESGNGGDGFFINRNIYQYSYIDSSFMRLLIIYGVVITVIFIMILSVCLSGIKSLKLILIVGLILISGIIEQHFFDIAYNPFFLLLVSDYFKERRVKLWNT